MADLFSQTEKTAISLVFDDIHDSFKRPVKVFTKVVANHSNTSANFNGIFGQNKIQNPSEPTLTSETIQVRVKHMDKSEVGKISGINTGTNISLPEGAIRLKVPEQYYNLIKKSSKIEFAGLTYALHSDAGKIGPFDINYYTLYFSRADT